MKACRYDLNVSVVEKRVYESIEEMLDHTGNTFQVYRFSNIIGSLQMSGFNFKVFFFSVLNVCANQKKKKKEKKSCLV